MTKQKQLEEMKKLVKGNHNRVCEKCGAGFTCDVENGKGNCWCFSVVVGKNVFNKEYDGCLCKTCLTKKDV